jgi:hypothetical protein
MLKSIRWFAAGLLSIVAMAGGARGADYVVTRNDGAIALMPELKDAPAPTWLKPGMRFVIHQMSATIPTTGIVFVEDENGNWVEKDTGHRFAKTGNIGSGGHGYMQADIVAVMKDAVAVQVRGLLINGFPNGLITPTTSGGYITTPSVLDYLYVNPDVLKKYLTLNGNGVTSVAMPYKTAGKTWNAVWQQITSQGGSTTTVFDTETGIILHVAVASSSPMKTVIVNGIATDTGGGTSLDQGTLLSVRQVHAPWTLGTLPAVLRNFHELVYRGIGRTFLDGVPPSLVEIHMRLVARGDDFVIARRTGTMFIGGNPLDLGTTNLVSGPSQILPLAVDPSDLAKLQNGQVLDTDPATGAVISVTSVGAGPDGEAAVTLTEQFPGANNMRSDFVYDKSSGLLVADDFTNPVLHQLTQLALSAKN